jgi:hypothetical protein
VDALSGLCCQSDEITDADGRCCSAALLDGCGVCRGTGLLLDRFGSCCSTPLTASGICCDDLGPIDSCGVCGGVNDCGAVVTADWSSAVTVNTTLLKGAPLRLLWLLWCTGACSSLSDISPAGLLVSRFDTMSSFITVSVKGSSVRRLTVRGFPEFPFKWKGMPPLIQVATRKLFVPCSLMMASPAMSHQERALL